MRMALDPLISLVLWPKRIAGNIWQFAENLKRPGPSSKGNAV